MKIELTDDEVREVGAGRYRVNKKWLWVVGTALLFITIGGLVPMTRFLSGLILFTGVPFIGVFFFGVIKVKEAAGRRFLEEQKHLAEMEAWEKPGAKSNPSEMQEVLKNSLRPFLKHLILEGSQYGILEVIEDLQEAERLFRKAFADDILSDEKSPLIESLQKPKVIKVIDDNQTTED